MNVASSNRPYQYSVKVSRRVRGIKIAVKPYLGVEVIVPPRFPRRQIDGILQQHDDWIHHQLQKHQPSFKTAALPDSITLPLNGQTFSIEYQTGAIDKLTQNADQILVQHRDKPSAIALLRQWLRKQAKSILPPLLQQIADEFGFRYQKVSIRSQKTRWGSCSSRGAISLNDQLLFMPPDTVRYLLIHELCHTRHMNHSKAFWKLVECCCSDFRRHDARLSEGRSQVPDWFNQHLLGAIK